MPALPVVEDVLWYANTLGYSAVAARLAGTGLHRVYPGFFGYVVFRALRSGGLRLLDPSKTAYGWAWLLSEPLVWILFGYVTLEFTSRALKDYRGLASLSRNTLAAGLVVAVAVSLSSLHVDASWSQGDFPILLGFNLARRAICSLLSIYLLLLVGFLLWFPVPIARNLLLHAVLLSFYSLAGTATLFIRNLLGPGVIPQVSVALMIINQLCMAGWLLLTRAGERRVATVRGRWGPEAERHMLGQLSALNQSLSRPAAGDRVGR
jgi:hypothetical protein